MAEVNTNKDRFVRWQANTIGQLSYTINLVLGLSIAALGFGISLLLDGRFNPVLWEKYFFTQSLILLIVSSGLGIWCTINRLRDFKITTKIVKKESEENSKEEVESLRKLSDCLGKKTWRIFWWQIGIFSAGTSFMIIAVALSARSKLF